MLPAFSRNPPEDWRSPTNPVEWIPWDGQYQNFGAPPPPAPRPDKDKDKKGKDDTPSKDNEPPPTTTEPPPTTTG
jgi:hypothetical protein